MPPRDPYKYFRIEARELLEGLRHGVSRLDRAHEDPALVPLLLRLAHTLKGAARVVRLASASELAHRLEDLLAPWRDNPAGPTPAQQDELQRMVGQIADRLAEIDRPPDTPAASTAPAAPIPDPVRLQAVEVEAALSGVAGTAAELAALRDDFGTLDHAGGQARRLLARAVRGRSAGAGHATAELAGETEELVVSLERARRRLLGRTDRIGRDLQRLHEDTARLRLLPTEALWSYLDRVVRDAAQTLGKRVRLETSSRTPRIDSPVFAGLQEALLHLTRNTVAHGIEPEEVRKTAGKPAEGCMRVSIEHRCDALKVVCEDDGGGIDTMAVRRAALARGWLPPDTPATLGMDEAIGLLLRGGMTTASQPGQMAGRGIGLEVVRTAVVRLGGHIAVRSKPGRGTTVTLELPVAVSAMEVLGVTAGDTTWLLPLGSVRSVLRPGSGDVRPAARGEELHAEGRVLPYASLSRIAFPTAPAGGRVSSARGVVVLRAADGSGDVALGVDRLLGTSEAIVRPLPALAAALPLVAGASLEAGGPPRLVAAEAPLIAAVRQADASAIPAAAPRPPILVVDDSLTTRMLEQSILESAGFVVDAAVSGEDALRRMGERRYGLLLVDVEMPGMDGFTLIEKLRADPAWRDVPAILVTSRDSAWDRRRGREAGAQDYVIKSEFDQRRLLQRINDLLP